jgi:inosose dehydratase
MAALKFACQTYSWQMSIDRYRGAFDHLASTTAAAGFSGIEPEIVMLGDGWTIEAVRAAVDRHGISLAALCLALPWTDRQESADEEKAADQAIDAVAAVPGAILNLCQLPGPDRRDLRIRQRNVLGCIAAIAERAADRGVHCTFHPNSPPGSVFRTAEDYDLLCTALPERVGFTPDLGHVVNGGMSPLDTVTAYRGRIDHIHYKDIDVAGNWVPTGEGVIDFVGITNYLRSTDYAGWIVLEDESPSAERDPDAAAIHNGRYVDGVLSR